MPRLPEKLLYLGERHVRGQLCEHWREDHGEETVEFYVSVDSHEPVRLTTEAVQSLTPVRETTPLMTYDFYDLVLGAPNEEAFRMKASSASPIFATSATLAIAECERVVQDMGFPYIHFLHTYYYV